jgi:hypothetical protein
MLLLGVCPAQLVGHREAERPGQELLARRRRFERNAFDLIVINSVVQYFPSALYLVQLLEQVVPLVKEGGTIFLGDVRSLPLHEAFHTSVALKLAPASLSAAEVRRHARQRLERDDELVVASPRSTSPAPLPGTGAPETRTLPERAYPVPL